MAEEDCGCEDDHDEEDVNFLAEVFFRESNSEVWVVLDMSEEEEWGY